MYFICLILYRMQFTNQHPKLHQEVNGNLHHGVRESKDFFLKQRRIVLLMDYSICLTSCPYQLDIDITQTF